MKKLFRKEDLLVSAVGAIGFGMGFALPKAWGQPETVCFISCVVLGKVMEHIGSRLIKTKWAQRSTANKVFQR